MLAPKKIKEKLAVTQNQKLFIEKSRETIRDLITGKDGRLALVLGPCSIHDLSAALEYGRRVRAVAEEVACGCMGFSCVDILKLGTCTG